MRRPFCDVVSLHVENQEAILAHKGKFYLLYTTSDSRHHENGWTNALRRSLREGQPFSPIARARQPSSAGMGFELRIYQTQGEANRDPEYQFIPADEPCRCARSKPVMIRMLLEIEVRTLFVTLVKA